ncbi:MAG TPA: TetR/AcrR family transcriptional regulator [Pseudolysinimonas sp.]|nr:TetR/AcrR family transcriptional regulator [Pseudolysinimonas sp.]
MAGRTEAGLQTGAAIRSKAAELFVAHGYEATSLRQISDAVGIKVGSLYNHISSKEALLQQILGATMDDLLANLSAALDGVDDPVERLIRMLDVHIRFHAERAQSVFLGNSELRSLQPEDREEVVAKRRAYREQIERLITEAGEAGRADVLDAHLHAFSIVAQGTHIASWYRPRGPLTLDEIVRRYSIMALREIGIADAAELFEPAAKSSAKAK